MARFLCRACARSGECEHEHHRRACPLCGSSEVVFAVAVEELPDEVLAALAGVAASSGDGPGE